jgi:superfamily II DNA or RNA helicase
MPSTDSITEGVRVRHSSFGAGRVEAIRGRVVIVHFEHGLEACEMDSLSAMRTPVEALELDNWHDPLATVTHAQALAIHSINDQWGVFSRSRIQLLPHQLWVCHKVTATWPTRWLVADDVGLGKTIEAGLVLLPLLSKGKVRRVLVICPASLVEQWQVRLRTMFDIRLTKFVPAADTVQGDFWGTHSQVVASLQTLRADKKGRHERIFESEPWDLLLVDEAHHLNSDIESGATLGYKFVERLISEEKVASAVFFSGTPHRGKDFAFLSLLSLLRPDLFDVDRDLSEQLPNIARVVIRNNKQNVTDLSGKRLFQAPSVSSETYCYSPEEAAFYEMLTDFITTGKAYASSLSASDARLVTLVLIAMQKLASSSVAAIRRALDGRLNRLSEKREKLANLQSELARLRSKAVDYEELDFGDPSDEISEMEETIAPLFSAVSLMEGEEDRLQELVRSATEVIAETKVNRILDVIDTRFAGEPVLLFTEYKATQSLLMSALLHRYGSGSVTFINGDEKADDVIDAEGHTQTLRVNRQTASDRFNSGDVRFLISTEAGGEGIDLQERCANLIHVDLPWNPMRLHQRVGRLNRYGQKKQVQVVTLRNPETVESRIWDKLNGKIGHIMRALGPAMDEPEDLFQLVLGMTSSSLFRELFTEAAEVPSETLNAWFEQKTATFGGVDVIGAVNDLVGHCARFDFQQASSHIPPLDLPALQPFLEGILRINKRRVRRSEEGIGFKTPELWLETIGIRTHYENLNFDRRTIGRDSVTRVLGVGNKLVDLALNQACELQASVTMIPSDHLPRPLIVLRVSDRVTGTDALVRAIIVGVEINKSSESNLLRDWEVLQRLNPIAMATVQGTHRAPSHEIRDAARLAVKIASGFVISSMNDINENFRIPDVEVVATFWPVVSPKD